jgi:hypothetical protein
VPPQPETKDWTWVLREPCPDCGFDASAYPPPQLPVVLADFAERWRSVLAQPDVRIRPDEATWSPLEYGAHTRDVCRVLRGRLVRILTEDRPTLSNWDHDAAAVDEHYNEQDPQTVAGELVAAARAAGEAFEAGPSEQWDRAGVRYDGAEFTVTTLGQYLVHEVRHHWYDAARPKSSSPAGDEHGWRG